MQEFLLRGTQPLPELNTDIIKKKLENKGVNVDADVDIRWRLLSGKTDTADSKLLLSRAVAIFHVSDQMLLQIGTYYIIHAIISPLRKSLIMLNNMILLVSETLRA